MGLRMSCWRREERRNGVNCDMLEEGRSYAAGGKGDK